MQVKFWAILYQTFLYPLRLLTPSSRMWSGQPTKNEGPKPKKRKPSSNFIGPRRHFIQLQPLLWCIVLKQEDQGGQKGSKRKFYDATPILGLQEDDQRSSCAWQQVRLSRGKHLVWSLASGPISALSLCLVPSWWIILCNLRLCVVFSVYVTLKRGSPKAVVANHLS